MRPTQPIEVFADVACPFTHVGLRRFVERRRELGRGDVVLEVRSWPLEIVNGSPLDGEVMAEEVDEIRDQVAPELFVGFDARSFPATTVAAMALAAVATQVDPVIGEQVNLELRDLLFEKGVDVSDEDVLRQVARDHDLPRSASDRQRVLDDHGEGVARGVVGSPHFFTPDGDFFCPSLDVSRDDGGNLRVEYDPGAFERFMESCFE